ncbi:MAG: ABC transporter ATP-binding protein [Chloroflexota bacterium]
MSALAIQATGLSKEYHIGGLAEDFDRLSDQLLHMVTAPARRAGKMLRGQAASAAELDETIWALKDISFEVNHGEVVGVIGRNGAGKSTLLKVLSRITDPTKGEALLYGRVGALLEVGTGFHPELTGRENVFLNGAILGMRKYEIEQRFDEIVAFAELDKFIDTPVKHYSSGMYVRLAFSVAAHLEPEILLVDEVLAVGDIAFQRKCLGKMDDVAQEGRTVLFVSHNMSLVQNLCERGLFLEDGAIVADGPIDDAVDAYLQSLEQAQLESLVTRTDRKGEGKAHVVNIEFSDDHARPTGVLKTGSPAHFHFEVDETLPDLMLAFSIYDHLGHPVAHFKSKHRGARDTVDAQRRRRFTCEMDELLLLPGHYHLNVSLIGDNRLQDFVEGAISFDVADGYIDGRPAVQDKKNRTRISLPHRWIVPAGM